MTTIINNHSRKTEKDFFVEAMMMSLASDFENIVCKTLAVSELPAQEAIKKFTSMQLEEKAFSILITSLSCRKLELSCRLVDLIAEEKFRNDLLPSVIDTLKISDDVIENAIAYADTMYRSKLVNFPKSLLDVMHALDEEDDGSSCDDGDETSESYSESG